MKLTAYSFLILTTACDDNVAVLQTMKLSLHKSLVLLQLLQFIQAAKKDGFARRARHRNRRDGSKDFKKFLPLSIVSFSRAGTLTSL